MSETLGRCCNPQAGPDDPDLGNAGQMDCGCQKPQETPPLLKPNQGCAASAAPCAGSSECADDGSHTPTYQAAALNQASMPLQVARKKLTAPFNAAAALSPSGGQACTGRLNPA